MLSHAGRIYNCPTRVYEFPKNIRHCTIGGICCLASGWNGDGWGSFQTDQENELISLFSAFNSITGDLMKIHNVEYSVRRYAEDRAKLNSERSAMGLDEHSFEYEMHSIPSRDSKDSKVQGQGGFDSAMLFHSYMLQTELIPMLEQLKSAEQARIVGDWWVRSGSDEKDDVDVDSLDLEREFSLYTGIQRLSVEPSLVNRIGFYNQDFGGKPRTVVYV